MRIFFSFSLPQFPRQPFMTKPFIITTPAVTYVSFYFMVCCQLASDILTSVLMAHGALFYMPYMTHSYCILINRHWGIFFFFFSNGKGDLVYPKGIAFLGGLNLRASSKSMRDINKVCTSAPDKIRFCFPYMLGNGNASSSHF